MKPSEMVSYAAILKNLKSRVNPEEQGSRLEVFERPGRSTSWSRLNVLRKIKGLIGKIIHDENLIKFESE